MHLCWWGRLKDMTLDAYTHHTHAEVVLNIQDSSCLLTGKKRSPQSGYTDIQRHTHILVCCFFFFFLPLLFTGQRVNKAAATFLWEASVTGRLTTINFHTGRGDSCKEKAKRIRNSPGHHLSSGLAKDTENSSVCVLVCLCVREIGVGGEYYNHHYAS